MALIGVFSVHLATAACESSSFQSQSHRTVLFSDFAMASSSCSKNGVTSAAAYVNVDSGIIGYPLSTSQRVTRKVSFGFAFYFHCFGIVCLTEYGNFLFLVEL